MGKQLFSSLGCSSEVLLLAVVRSEDRIRDGQELPHACDERDLLLLSCGKQPSVEGSDCFVVASRHKRGHVQAAAGLGAPAPDAARAAQLPAVTRKGSHSNQLGDLLAVEPPE